MFQETEIMPATTAKDTAANRPSRQRDRDAIERSVAVLKSFQKIATTEEMERIVTQLEQALQPLSPVRERTLLQAVSGGRTTTEQERLALESANLARYFQRRQELLRDSLSAVEVAHLLGTSRQTPHDRARARTLLAVRERGGLRFPRWQFDPNGPDGVLANFVSVLRALDVIPLAQVSWFVRSNPYLEGRTPLEALRAGEGERLVSIARGVGGS
jgi:hypothetical protein